MKIEEILRSKGSEVVGLRPTGIITERDVLRLTARAPGQLGSMTVGSVMTREVITASPQDSLTTMMDVMTENRIRHLPVIDADRLVGIISIGDLVNACRASAEAENTHLRQYIQGVG
jgi:CBS domain-containing protein